MWDIDFITELDLKKHIKKTIKYYGLKLESINLQKFNNNIIDPIKLIFDKYIYNISWEEVIKSEVHRQRDKSNNNEIGYFHQNIFNYINNCMVPKNGEAGGWDIIYKNDNILISNDTMVDTVYVEMKNKHNTMNSSSSQKTYIRAQNQILQNNKSACFLVEAISSKSQNIPWKIKIDGNKMENNYIRRVSLDKFYELVTGDTNSFFKICMVLPQLIQDILKNEEIYTPNDTVYSEIVNIVNNKNITFELALYMLGFGTYNNFNY